MNVQACLLIYDIPDGSGIPNPSRRLRSLAVRVNLSCWVIPKDAIPYNLLNSMAERGATWHVVKFDTAEGERLVAMAIDSIKRDIRLALNRARSSSDRIRSRLDEPAEGDEAADAYRRNRRDAAAVVSRLRRMLRDFEAVAVRFGISKGSIGIAGAVAATDAISAGMRNRARAYAASVRELAGIMGDDDGMVREARADRVSHGVLADYMEDHGIDATSVRLGHFADLGFEP